MRPRPRYIASVDAEPGMVLGSPVRVVEHGRLRFALPAGHSLTRDNLHQLMAHHAEYIFITEADSRRDEDVAVDAALAARRVMEIFDGADLADPVMAALFDQILIYRSA